MQTCSAIISFAPEAALVADRRGKLTLPMLKGTHLFTIIPGTESGHWARDLNSTKTHWRGRQRCAWKTVQSYTRSFRAKPTEVTHRIELSQAREKSKRLVHCSYGLLSPFVPARIGNTHPSGELLKNFWLYLVLRRRGRSWPLYIWIPPLTVPPPARGTPLTLPFEGATWRERGGDAAGADGEHLLTGLGSAATSPSPSAARSCGVAQRQARAAPWRPSLPARQSWPAGDSVEHEASASAWGRACEEERRTHSATPSVARSGRNTCGVLTPPGRAPPSRQPAPSAAGSRQFGPDSSLSSKHQSAGRNSPPKERRFPRSWKTHTQGRATFSYCWAPHCPLFGQWLSCLLCSCCPRTHGMPIQTWQNSDPEPTTFPPVGGK